ncbi:MAG: thiamine diphosphokinase [Clostridia bacterium]|nr:thiamine diphosphokinase [Clostridia bacterium]
MGVEETIVCYIFCGGEFTYSKDLFSLPKPDYTIAADSGMYGAITGGFVPDLFIGDFDSFDFSRLSDENRQLVNSVPSVRYPVKKDLTDSAIAAQIAVEKGADSIYFLGGLGGRLDHTLSNVFLLRALKDRGVSAVIDSGCHAVRYIENECCEIKKRYKYISFFAYSDDARGVTAEGVEYPLRDAVISRNNPSYAVSNSIIGEKCRISVENGGLLVVESNE